MKEILERVSVRKYEARPVEREKLEALLRAATGYTVTDRTIRCVNGVKTVETKERHIPPSQPAIEFYLINKKGGDYSRNGGGSGNADGALADILEALKNG